MNTDEPWILRLNKRWRSQCRAHGIEPALNAAGHLRQRRDKGERNSALAEMLNGGATYRDTAAAFRLPLSNVHVIAQRMGVHRRRGGT